MKGKNNPYHQMSKDSRFRFASHPGKRNPRYLDKTNDEIIYAARQLFERDGNISKRSWEKFAKENGFPQSVSNDFRFGTFGNLKSCAIQNHRVKSVEFDGFEDVYNITVEDNHNYNVITSNRDGEFIISSGITVKNCGEIPLPEHGVCCLGNVNLTRFVTDPFSGGGWKDRFDIQEYTDTLRLAVRFLDDVLDTTDYPFEENRARAVGERRIGVNPFSGLGSTLALLGMRYGSKESIKFVNALGAVAVETVYSESVELAKSKGPFQALDVEKFLKSKFVKERVPKEIQAEIRSHGIRNCALLTVPPVGTGSLVANNISNGLEPIFALEYERRMLGNDDKWTVESVEDYAWCLYKKEGLRKGTEIPEFFQTSREIPPTEHIDVQAAVQHWIDQSCSKTVNIPKEITLEDYEKLVLYAFEKGCKGFTSFREGTREGILSVKEEKKRSGTIRVKAEEPKKRRPRVLDGKTYKVSDDKGNLYITISNIEEKGRLRPYEIFLNSNGENSEYMPWYRALSKLMSAVMRRTDSCDFLIKDLQSIYGEKGYWADGRYVLSQPQMVGNILEEHVKLLHPDSPSPEYTRCPECKDTTFIKEGGCGKCLSCGFSACG